MATTVTHYVDPNSSAGGTGHSNALSGADRAYVSLNAWEAAEQGNLPALDIISKVVCSSDDAGATHAADSTAVAIVGWTTDATRYIQIEAASSHGGKWNTGIYRIEVTGDTDAITINEDYVNITGIQIQLTASTGVVFGIVHDVVGTSIVNIKKCVIKAVLSGSAIGHGIYGGDLQGTTNIYNCISYDFNTSGSSGFRCVNGVVNAYNSTAHNCTTGFLESSGTFSATNCGAASCTTGFSAGVAQTTCSSSSPTFVNEGADDFHLASGDTTWKDQGTDLSATFTDDIDGVLRTGTWDIGADEYVAAGGGGNPWNYYAQQ